MAAHGARPLGLPAGFYTPRVALFCPVKGIEPGLEQNLTALTSSITSQYEIFFAVATAEDPAYPLLERIAANSKRPVHVVCAGRPKDCGEKVNNLRAAVERAASEFDVLVFTDSDGRPPRRWLSRLVAPLADERSARSRPFAGSFPARRFLERAGLGLECSRSPPISASITTISAGAAAQPSAATALSRCARLEAWNGSVSDDFSLTSALWRAGFPIVFAPECLVASPVPIQRARLFRIHQPPVRHHPRLRLRKSGCARCWAMSYMRRGPAGSGTVDRRLGAGASQLSKSCSWRCCLRSLSRFAWRPAPDRSARPAPGVAPGLLAYGWAWTLLAPLAPFFSLYNTIVAAFSRKIVWRGIRYELFSRADAHLPAESFSAGRMPAHANTGNSARD